MTGHRLTYGLILTAAFLNWLLHGSQFGFYWLIIAAFFPWLSLGMSLGAVLGFRMSLRGQRECAVGQKCDILLVGHSKWPMPPFRGRVRLLDCLTGKELWYDSSEGLPTAHCGGYRAKVCRGRVCDYLGLFAIPVRGIRTATFAVFPEEKSIENLPDFSTPKIFRWQFGHSAEPYELRPYRRGDDPKKLHWKLSFKAGSPIIREGQEPRSVVLTVEAVSRGSREELDVLFGQLLWLGKHLLACRVPFRIRVLTGRGVQVLPVADEESLKRGIGLVMQHPCASAEDIMPPGSGIWRYVLSGGGGR